MSTLSSLAPDPAAVCSPCAARGAASDRAYKAATLAAAVLLVLSAAVL